MVLKCQVIVNLEIQRSSFRFTFHQHKHWWWENFILGPESGCFHYITSLSSSSFTTVTMAVTNFWTQNYNTSHLVYVTVLRNMYCKAARQPDGYLVAIFLPWTAVHSTFDLCHEEKQNPFRIEALGMIFTFADIQLFAFEVNLVLMISMCLFQSRLWLIWRINRTVLSS